jgi:osmotically-inducible protein OsmY
VRLTGLVGSVAQQELARSDAFVVGVDTVDASAVSVDWLAFDDQRRTSTYATRADADLAQAVREAFSLDPRLTTLIPQVAVKSGMATLTGTVDSPKARGAAASDAKNTLGVWSVRNEVLVQPNGRPTDADVERAVRQVLSEDPVLSYGKSIQVSAANGKVTLNGTIPSGLDRLDVLADIERVPGVVELDDNLTVKRSSADIKTTIEDLIFWDPMVERSVVNVAVAPDGVTTLTGTVATWSELKAASNDAFGGGAARVINLLKLNKHSELVVP